MRKEVLFAVISGIVFGIIVAFGISRANSALKSKPTTTSAPTPAAPSPAPSGAFELSLVKPEEGDVLTESPTIASGVTAPSSWVVVSAAEEDYITRANESGAFSQEVNLVGGINRLTFTALDENAKSATKSLTVVFSSEFAKDAGLASDATESAKP